MSDITDATRVADAFFESYTRALLDRDPAAIADLYAVPALIEFPGEAIAVTDRSQTERFFEGAFAQYADVTESHALVTVVASAPHSIWVDARWDHHGGAPDERSMYQLALRDGEWRIAVLTPLDG